MQTGNCYRCHQPGHWMSNCPTNPNKTPPAIHCPCGSGLCDIKISNTVKNPGKKFYNCPAVHNCQFFKWCDSVTDKDLKSRPTSTIPNCPCGSGPCRREIDSSGRAYLTCCIKKGFGACGYFKWEDNNNNVEIVPVDEIDFWLEVSDVESSYQVKQPPVEVEGSVITEDDSIFDNVDAQFVSATMNQGVTLYDPTMVEEDEILMKASHGDQSTDEAMSYLVRDTDSTGSVAKHETKSCEQMSTGESQCPVPDMNDLIEQYNAEKIWLERVSGKHVEVLSAFMGSYKRLRLLHEKTSDLRRMLVETEEEMACCEAETLEFGASCREVAEEMAESQKRMQETAAKLGKEVEALKENELVAMKRRRS